MRSALAEGPDTPAVTLPSVESPRTAQVAETEGDARIAPADLVLDYFDVTGRRVTYE